MPKTATDRFADTLAVAGVKGIYGIAGDSLDAVMSGRGDELSDLAKTNLWR